MLRDSRVHAAWPVPNLTLPSQLLPVFFGFVCSALPESYGYKFLYGSVILAFCLGVCLLGAGK